MTSRQINFYVLPKEQAWLEEVIRSAGTFVIVGGLIKEDEPILLKSTVIERFGKEDLKVYLVREADIAKLSVVKAPSRSELFIDDLRSPVIEFSRCFSDGKLLRRGRLYFVESYYDQFDKEVKKDSSFIEWGRSTLTAVRRSLKRRDDGDYASTKALECEHEAGLHLTAA